MRPLLELRSASKSFTSADGVIPVLDRFSFSFFSGDFVAVLGPSGCGKSTILRILGGLEFPDHGAAYFSDELVTRPPEQVGFMFQSYDCFPWKTVADNVRVGLLGLDLTPAECDRRVIRILDQVSLTEFRNSFPYQLSGGMKQRVALARTIIASPPVLLLDEPFGAVDLQLRVRLQSFVCGLFEQRATQCVVFATHDISEAVRIGTKVVVLGSRPARIIFEARTKRADPSAPTNEQLLLNCREALATVNLS